MPTVLSVAVEYGGYISLAKFIAAVVLFFAWMPLVNWVHADTQAVRTDVRFWTSIVVVMGATAFVLWLLAPLFIIGILIYVIAVGASALAYIIHRNSRVSDFERVLTASHIKSFFVNEKKRMAKASRGMSFITANGNNVPIPKAKTPEAFGFRVCCEVFEDALWRRVSDVMFRPGTEDAYDVIYRIDGLATKQPLRTKEEMEFFIHYIKLLADLDTKERRKPQAGNMQVVQNDTKIEWEVTSAGSTAGEQIKLTRLGWYSLMNLENIGLSDEQVKAISTIRNIHSGVVMISGPKKSGVTTTMYTMLRNHDPFMNNINTLEKNPAVRLESMTQHVFELSKAETISYAKKLQSILRMGPDIIGIEACEDAQCAALACAAAKDGKIVYVTIEATSVMQAIAKWLNLVPNKELVGNTLAAVMNQRLVRTLCPECKQAYKPNQNLFKKFNVPAEKMEVLYRAAEIEYDKHGKPILCEKCQGTGYFGRAAVFETIVLDESLKQVVRQAKSLKEIAALFRRAGMTLLQEEAIRKGTDGITSINEIIRHLSTKPKDEKPGKKPK